MRSQLLLALSVVLTGVLALAAQDRSTTTTSSAPAKTSITWPPDILCETFQIPTNTTCLAHQQPAWDAANSVCYCEYYGTTPACTGMACIPEDELYYNATLGYCVCVPIPGLG